MLSNWAESVGLRERAAAPQYTSNSVTDVEGASARASRAEASANFDARDDDDDGADDAGGAIDKFRRRARRRSLTGSLDAGFTNFTSGIKTGWNVEAMSGKFRQVRGPSSGGGGGGGGGGQISAGGGDKRAPPPPPIHTPSACSPLIAVPVVSPSHPSHPAHPPDNRSRLWLLNSSRR